MQLVQLVLLVLRPRATMGKSFACPLVAAALLLPAAAGAERPPQPTANPFAPLAALASADEGVRRRAAERLLAAGDRSLVPPLVDQLFFVPTRHRADALRALAGLTGEHHRELYLDWVQYVGDHPELAPPPGYLAWKGRLLSRLHPRFGAVLREGAPARIRPEEIVFGGVGFDGIPSLERPAHTRGERARLSEDDLVFAAVVGGEARAWPLAVLSWHEMLNDRLGGQPVTLSFCTLCRSAVLYHGRLPDGRETTFGTSGLLYRSNKLMFDRATLTLWSNLTGEPVLGPLAREPRPLAPLPLVLATWGSWRRAHPATTVMVGDPRVASRYGYDYRPGAADRRREGVTFPVPGGDARLPPKEEVWGVRLGSVAKAYATAPLLAAGVVNDTVGGEPLVLIADAGGAVRAYRRGDRHFRAGEAGELLDADGARWRLAEDVLRPLAGAPAPLPRLPLFPSFWFGWRAFYPASELWTGGAGAE